MDATIYSPTLTTIDAITIDATISEQPQADVEATEHPVEEGSPVTDHARSKPEVLTLECMVSNTPLSAEQAARAADMAGMVSTENEPVQATPGYAEAVYRKLRDLKDAHRLIQIVTSARAYDDMLMTSLSAPRNAQTGDALHFTASFKQVRQVRNKLTTIAVTKEARAKKKVDLGQQATKPADAKLESVAHSGVRRAGGAAKAVGGLLGL